MRFFRSPDSADQAASLAPVGQTERITIIDTVRGVALLGILLMNIPGFGLPYQMYFNLNVRNEHTGANYYTWWIVNGGFEGTMRALFTMLFGAGSLLLLERHEKKSRTLSAADIYFRRLLWLLLFGVINAFIFLWPGDILYSYAICGLLLFPFRKWKPSWLLILGLVIMLISGARYTLDMYEAKDTRIKGEKVLSMLKKDSTVKLTDEQKAEKAKWEAAVDKHKIENIRKAADKDVKEYKKGYFSLMSYLKDINVKLQSKVFYDDYIYDVMCLLFIGMALFKWGVLTGERSIGFYWMLFLGGYALGLPLSLYMLHNMIVVDWDHSRLADQSIVSVYQLKRFLVAMGHLGVIMLLYKYGLATWLLNILAKVGQMAFTNYLSQSIFCAIIFDGFGFGLFGDLERYQIYFVCGAIWVFQIIFSNIWLKYYYFGPFEWVWRSLTYWKKQPMRRNSKTPLQPALA